MSPIPHTWPIVGLVALSLTVPALSRAETGTEGGVLPIIEAAAAQNDQPAATPAADHSTATAADGQSRSPAEPIATLRHKLNQVSVRLANHANQTNQRLAEHTQRIQKLQQQINRVQKRLKPPQNPSDRPTQAKSGNNGQPNTTHPTNESQSWPTETADTGADDTSAESADTTDQAKASATPHAAARDSCSSDQADRLAFDVFYQASTDTELADARAAVKADAIDDWFVLPELERLYVGRYGTCQLARRRQAHIHERTGLSLRIDAVKPAPDTGENADTAATQRHNAKTTTAGAPFHIVGVEQRSLQTYLGLATATPTQPGDITWLQPGQVYYGWHLEAVHRYAGTASFAVDGQTVTVALPE